MNEKQSHPVQIKPKPWGREIWFAQTDQYAGKILEVKKGHRYSLQYHEHKKETQFVYSGKIKMVYGDDENDLKEVILNPGDKFDVLPYTIHRAEGLEDSEIFEVSTPELDDVVKLADDYGRSGKGNNEELDQKLHNEQSL
jgi:mannose-6-phosphate isomerase-like protein (cupin superfamily)